MSKTILFLCLLVGSLYTVTADSLVSFPYKANPCSCNLLTCTCCTGISVAKVGFSKNVCVKLNVKLLSLTVDVTITLDSKTLVNFSFSATNPPTYCIPIALPVQLKMCLKIHDMKLVGLTGVQICMTVYAAYDGSNVFVQPLNCVKISAGALQYFTTTTTTPKTG